MSLSPDGQWLAFLGDDGSKRGIFAVSTVGGAPRLLEEIGKGISVVAVWSPDGNWLAYARGRELIRTSRDGRVRETLAALSRWHEWSVRWSPDGTHLAAFGSTVEDRTSEDCGVYVVRVADKVLRKITPDSEPQWKEGLEWHPGREFLTYMIYGPGPRGSQIRHAYRDCRPSELMIQQPRHWDYLGIWTPDGLRYIFNSSEMKPNKASMHLYHAPTREIAHRFMEDKMNWLPRWSWDGKTAAWANQETQRYFEELKIPREK